MWYDLKWLINRNTLVNIRQPEKFVLRRMKRGKGDKQRLSGKGNRTWRLLIKILRKMVVQK